METTFERIMDGTISKEEFIEESHEMVAEVTGKREPYYTLRRLEAKDIAPMASIISKMGWKQFKDTFQTVDPKDMGNPEALGMTMVFDMVGIVLANYEKCQSDVFSFLSSLSGMKVKQIESLAPAEFAEMVIAVISKKEFKDFFTVVQTLFK